MTAPPSPNSAAQPKRRLRRRIIGKRDAIPLEERRASSEAICARVIESAEFRSASFAVLFASFGSEVDTTSLMAATLAAGKRLALPRVHPVTRELELREVQSIEKDLAPGLWDIPEPVPAGCPEVALEEIDFVLVPGVAFDRDRRRLGYGGGYYDRILARLSPGVPAIAICFGAQLVPEVPADHHDLRVPVIITENERIEQQ